MTDTGSDRPVQVQDPAPGGVPGVLPLAEVSRHFRRAVVIAVAVGVAALIITALVGDVGVGMLFCVGLGLGSINGAAVQITAGRYAMRSEPDKKRFALGVLGRLAIVSAIALVVAVVFRPEGLAVLFGLAFFQLLLLAAGAGSMIRALRQEGRDA
jgi:drug/metabolite transporter (DMT)-like permease